MANRLLQSAREWLLRLFGATWRRPGDAALRRELEQHLELAEQDLIARGYPPQQAARLARARHGQPDNALEELRRQRGIPWFGAFTIDVRLGLRMLRKFPGLTLIGGLALTVGFGVLTAVFTYFDVIVWTGTVPLDDGEDVVAVQLWDPERSRRSETTIADFERWRDSLQTLEDVGAFRTVQHEASFPNGGTDEINVAEMSAAGFRVARVDPVLGRTLLETDERFDAEPVIVIGHDEW
ncbi:MAG TPA: permease prefix domain 1-containing protein, partial [Gammaproteobacteria bacterium]|nr:permease prefix domain 1-containing protein [Gammaproteobacteria bacterium]